MIIVAAMAAGASADIAGPLLANLAGTDEVVVVCGYHHAAPLLAELRARRPATRLIGLVADPPTRAEADLVCSLLEEGAFPVVVTAPDRIDQVGQWLTARLGDTMLLPFDPASPVAVG